MQSFVDLHRRLLRIDYFGQAGDTMPLPGDIVKAVTDGALTLPHAYAEAYSTPLTSNLPHILQLLSDNRLPAMAVETLTGAVYQHRSNSSLQQPLKRFLAVVSNMYRSFSDGQKRLSENIPLLRQSLPPLALFQHQGGMGPFTLTFEEAQQLIGSTVGVASLPATYASDPLIWAILAHETGGHSVTHADPGLLAELSEGIPAAIKALPAISGVSIEQLAMIWSYWIDEASADVYGILNIGPAFSPNMAAFFSAAGAQGAMGPPKLRMQSRYSSSDPSMLLDPHPTDILRLHLALGAVEALANLSSAARDGYCAMIIELSTLLANGDSVLINGNIPIQRDHLEMVNLTVPLTAMQAGARAVGRFIATAHLDALNSHSIQDIETWDDYDESRAQLVKDALLAEKPIISLGDDAHLLAGATIALLEDPTRYDQVTSALNAGLDDSFRRDPVWGGPVLDSVFLAYSTEAPQTFWRNTPGVRTSATFWSK